MKMKTIDLLQGREKDTQKEILLQICKIEQNIKETSSTIFEKENKYTYVYNNRFTPKYLVQINHLYLEKLKGEIKELKEKKISLESELKRVKGLLVENLKEIKKYDILRNKENEKIKEELKHQEEKEMQDMYISLYNKKTNHMFD